MDSKTQISTTGLKRTRYDLRQRWTANPEEVRTDTIEGQPGMMLETHKRNDGRYNPNPEEKKTPKKRQLAYKNDGRQNPNQKTTQSQINKPSTRQRAEELWTAQPEPQSSTKEGQQTFNPERADSRKAPTDGRKHTKPKNSTKEGQPTLTGLMRETSQRSGDCRTQKQTHPKTTQTPLTERTNNKPGTLQAG